MPHPAVNKPTDTQVDGDHYTRFKIQPAVYIHANELDYLSGRAITYLSRWKWKGELTDLRKAKHMIDLLIELEFGKNGLDESFHQQPETETTLPADTRGYMWGINDVTKA